MVILQSKKEQDGMEGVISELEERTPWELKMLAIALLISPGRKICVSPFTSEQI